MHETEKRWQLWQPEISWLMMASGIDWIAVSVDGTTTETYEMIRNGSNFYRICENVQAMPLPRKDVGFAITFIMYKNK